MSSRIVPGALVDDFRVLVVEDEPLYARAISRELERHDVPCDVVGTVRDGLARAARSRYAVVLLDHRLPDGDGVLSIPHFRAHQIAAAVIVMTAYETIDDAVQAIRLGAEDYLVKQPQVAPIVERVLELRRRDHFRRSRESWNDHRQRGLLGESASIRRVVDQLRKVARGATTTVLLTGETGVGKEVAARYLHDLSHPVQGRPGFVTVDCIALPDTLVESTLFGHERGAFTGADRTKNGAFHDAGHGTLLLDEIGDMDPALQGKLLRVLESRSYQLVGSVKEHPFHGRVVAATNRDLSTAVEERGFRFDLYQRLATFPIELPPLRERGDDVLLLAEHFVRHFSQQMGVEPEPLSSETQDLLLAYDYPGNVRELKNAVERAVIMSESGRIEPAHLPERMLRPAVSRRASSGDRPAIEMDFIPGVDTLETLEKKMIRHALGLTSGAKGDAAKLLGISRFQLLRRLEKYGMSAVEED